MNCEHACSLAALAASGDVTVEERSALDLHLANCEACRVEADGFAAILGQLSELQRESPPDHTYAAVRRRVAAEIVERRSRWLAAWPAFAAVLACSVVLVVLLRPVATVVNLPAHVVPAESSIVPEPIRTGPVVRLTRRTVTRPTARKEADPLVVHMFTDDPDVVIYWIADGRGDRSKKETFQ